MNLFLDASVLLAASASASGASREIFRRAGTEGWVLVTTPYTLEEVLRNLPGLPPRATAEWAHLRLQLLVMDNILTLDRPAVFPVTKDRPVLFSALAWADILLTLDRGDFGPVLGSTFYGLRVLKPGSFLERERLAGRLSDLP